MNFRTNPWLHIFRAPDDAGGGDAGGGDAGGGDAAAQAAAAAAKAAGGADPAAADAAKTAGAGDKSAAPAFDYGKWADGLADEGKKDYAKRFKSVDDLIDGGLNLRKEISGRIKVPGKDATPEDRAAFNKAIGADPAPENYKAALPEGYELGEVQTALLGAMQKAAAAEGVPVPAFAEFTKTYFEMEAAVQAKVAEEVAQFQRDSTAAIKKEFGPNFETHMRVAENFVNQKLGVPEFIDLLNDQVQWKGVTIQLRDHPAIVKTLAQIGLRTAEDGVIGHTTPDERTSIEAEIAKLRSEHPVGTSLYTPDIDRKLKGLYQKLYG